MNERRRAMMGLGEGMVRITYLGFTGTQRIDTGIVPNTNTVVRTMFKNIVPTGGIIIGYAESTDTKDWRLFNYNRVAYFDVMSSRINGSRINEGTVYELELGNNYVKNLKTGSNILTGNPIQYTGVGTILISEDSSNLFYYVQIFDGNTMIMDLVPVKIGNVGYMYDRITRQLLGNTGSGDFELSGTNAPSGPIMTSVTNPEVLAVCYAQGWCSAPDYMTFDEAVRVTDIGTVFNNNTSITHFDELKYFSLSSIDNNAFYGCSSLENITLPETVTSIGEYAFYSCTSLQEIGGYENVLSIGKYCFANCNSLVHFTIPNAVSDINVSCFQGSGAEITLHNNIVYLRNMCFSGCRFSDTELVFPNLASCLFGAVDSTNATKISIVDSQLSYLAQHAFSNNLYLEKVELNESLTQIQADVFANCPVLSEIFCANMSAPDLHTSGLTSLPNNGVIKVPIGATGYDQGGWAYLVNNKGWTIVNIDV